MTLAHDAAGPAIALINPKSGTVRTRGPDEVSTIVQAALQSWNKDGEARLIDGKDINRTVDALIKEKRFRTILVGGGDGTIASVAGQLIESDIRFGILPLGTMNLVAKALGFSQTLEDVLVQLEDAEVKLIDVGRAGDHIFLHGLSLGMQPRMIRIRERLGYRSRFTKILAGGRAMLSVLLKPQSLRLKMDIDGHRLDVRSPAVVISNNIYEDSMWLRPQTMDDGVLGIYTVSPMSKLALVRLGLDLLRGRWRDNLNVREEHARSIRIEKHRRFSGKSKRIVASLDGEIMLLPLPLNVEILPQSLKVLAPRST